MDEATTKTKYGSLLRRILYHYLQLQLDIYSCRPDKQLMVVAAEAKDSSKHSIKIWNRSLHSIYKLLSTSAHIYIYCKKKTLSKNEWEKESDLKALATIRIHRYMKTFPINSRHAQKLAHIQIIYTRLL